EDEAHGSPTNVQDDPLALETLHLTDDLTGGHSPFAVHRHNRNTNAMKRIMSVMKKEKR
ncbi:MAG: hypothetical protein INR71_06280, partial [Terriglobus roseus]|nr:hypothetical protein [Terriglobus roseus]